jgi:hypothetical protein
VWTRECPQYAIPGVRHRCVGASDDARLLLSPNIDTCADSISSLRVLPTNAEIQMSGGRSVRSDESFPIS